MPIGNGRDDPAISYPIRDVLKRIEDKLDRVIDRQAEFAVSGSKNAQDALRDAHELDIRVAKLELSQASQTGVRVAITLAVVSGPGSALLTWLLTRH